MKQKIKVVFFGSFGEFSKVYLRALKESNFDIVLAIEDKKANFVEIKGKMEQTKPDLGVIAYFGAIIPKEVLKIPKYGFINIHPSLLPRWRGPSPIQNAILAGNKTTGITIHLTTDKIDAGDILTQKEILILPDDTCATLTERLADEGAKLLTETIPGWIKGNIIPRAQNESKATFTKIIKKGDGLIDWSKSPEYIERMVRAYNPWPGTYTKFETTNSKSETIQKILKIKKVEIIDGKLKIITVQPEGKKDMPYEAFLRGHKNLVLGD